MSWSPRHGGWLPRFSDLSVKHKLVLMTTSASAAALFLLGGLLIAVEVRTFRASFLLEREILTRVVAENVSAALFFEESGSAKTILRSLEVDQDMISVSVLDSKNNVFASTVATGEHQLSPRLIPLEEGHRFEDGNLIVTWPVEQDGEIIGAVSTQSSMRKLRIRLQRYLLIMAAIIPLSFFGSLLMSARVRRAVSDPILQLAHVATRVSSEQDYTLRIEMERGDEIGTLVGAWNSMLSEINQRDIQIADRQARLEAAQRNTEAEVIERTSELFTANKRLTKEIRERYQAEEERDRLNVQLLHAQKLEAIGQLAAGIAHEINTPMQYIGDNTYFLEESFKALVPLLKMADELAEAAPSELADGLKAALEEADVEFLASRVPRAIERSLDGIDRVRKIVQSLKEFSHPGTEGMTDVDLNRAIESTVTISTNEWKYVAEMETDLDPELPPVPCLPGELNQVILNLVVNAAHAIADVVSDEREGKGTIAISTRRDGELVEIRIADTGTGIPEEVRDKIFDPFFTTKEVGKGTGQGLSIACAVVVQKHGGTLDFETEIGKGTTFIIRLPLERQSVEEPV